MRLRIIGICATFLMLAGPGAHAQEIFGTTPRKVTVGGYLKFLQTVQFQEVGQDWLTDNIFHNRLNFKWYLTDGLTVTAELRTRLFYGESVKYFPGYQDFIDDNSGYAADLSAVWAEGNSFFIHSILDRLNVDWSTGDWQVRLGRQRINWGQTFVWNPNDLFNAYSFFDFDYEERPGSDALLVRRYLGPTSSLEVAASLGADADDYRVAAMYRWNRSNYDYQVLAGKVADDYALGVGWSGEIGTAGFKGEATWLEPVDSTFSGGGAVVAALSGDYTFPSSLFVHSEVLYNSHVGRLNPGGLESGILTMNTRSPRMLSFSRWSWLNEASYPITPLVKVGLYSIWFPDDTSVFVGPNAEVSISDNVYLLFLGQFFLGPDDSRYGQLGYFNYLRLKWSF